MKTTQITRRKFVRDSAVATAAVAAGLNGQFGPGHLNAEVSPTDSAKILNYNSNMEYRRLGKTGLMVSVIGLGGHSSSDDQQRKEVVNRCLDFGINYIDSTGSGELHRDIKALGQRRNQVYLALSETGREPRNPGYRTAKKLLGTLDDALKGANLEYTDLWRITVYEPGGRHTFDTSCEVVEALETAKKQGKARFVGISSHDRRWFKFMIEYFPQLEVILFPFTTMTKAAPKDSLFEALKKCDVGAFGIKPFAGGSLFSGNQEEDLKRARLAIRYILHTNTVIPIPGLNNAAEADNAAKAVTERRQLDLKEKAELEQANEVALAQLPVHYQWLKEWQCV
ncbi:MAG: aldo/keto reductase [Candidatus Omnitrophica bacterium]|nr:aldo/keto reductase [Candidatus Omnitrophota bacterium]